MASSWHTDPSLLSIDIPKTPGGDGKPDFRFNLMKTQTGMFGPSTRPDTSFLDLGWKAPVTPGGDHRSDMAGLNSADVDSTREETPGIDIVNLPKTPLGTTTATARTDGQARTDDRLKLKLALKPATTATGLVQSLALVDVKEELCMSSAEWLRFQQEIIKFLDQGEWLYKSYHEAAYAFLEGTGANERFFGMLAGAEAEGLLVNRGGLAWDLDNDRIIELAAMVVAAWKDAPDRSLNDTEENTARKSLSPVEMHPQVRPVEQSKSQLMPQVIAMLPRDIIDECMAAFPVKKTRKRTNHSNGDDEDDEGSALFLSQQRTSVKRKRQIIESDDEQDDEQNNDGNKSSKELQTTSVGNKRRRNMAEAHTSSLAARTTVSTRNPGSQLFVNRAWPTLIGDTLTGPQMWTNRKPSMPAPWMPSTLHIHGSQRGPMKLLSFNSILTLDALLYQFRNAFNQEMSTSTVTNKCQAVRRIRVFHKSLLESGGLRIEDDDTNLWKETMEKLRKKMAGKEVDRISGSIEVHY